MELVKIKKIQKRNGEVVDFDENRIRVAIKKAYLATIKNNDNTVDVNDTFLEVILEQVLIELDSRFSDSEKVPNIEDIQDIVELKLVGSGYFEIAKSYILYRAEHAKTRAISRLEELKKIEQNLLTVTKNNAKEELFDINKIKKVFKIVNKGFEKECSFGELYETFKNRLIDGIPTSQILDGLIKSCLDLITVENIKWQNIAGRLYALRFYKEASRNRKVPYAKLYSAESFSAHFRSYMDKGYYYRDFYKYYSDDDILEAGKYIKGERDFNYIYSTMLAFDRRYMHNPNRVICELPQDMYMAVALFLAIPEEKANRLNFAKRIYDVTSTQKLSLPTPTLLNARTNFHQLASCFKLNVDDDLRAIYHSIENIAQISKFGGGVGVYLGRIRSRGGSIRGVKGASGGVVPWVKVINDTACAVNQLGSRMGAISPTLDIWHRDINDFLNLQTETGDIRSKAFDIFPAVSIPDNFMERVKNNEKWTLFDPHEIFTVTGKRMESLFGNEFREFYEKCEKDENIRLKNEIRAKDLMKELLKTTVETGMPYVFFRDTVNGVNPNKHVGNIYSTQLCTEICQNTAESKFVTEEGNDGEVVVKYKPGDTVVCNLASINIAKVNTDEDINEVFPVVMRVLDNVITLNYYPVKESEITSKRYRSVGLGFMGLAEYLACTQLSYDSEEACGRVDALFEKYAYAALNESSKLAQERGTYDYFEGSQWQKGVIFGRDEKWYRDNSKAPDLWEELIVRIKEKGLRFAYHMAPAPNTSTSVVMGTTAGLLPIYKKLFIETNAIAPIVTVAPNLSKENFWHYKEYINMDMNDVIRMISVVYKWIDQSISFEWMINPEKTSPKELFDYYFNAWERKIKTIYYVRSMSGDVNKVCESCAG